MALFAVTGAALLADALVSGEDHLPGDVAHRPALPVGEVQPLRPPVLVDGAARELRPRDEEQVEGLRDGRAVAALGFVGIDPPRHLGEPRQRLPPGLLGRVRSVLAEGDAHRSAAHLSLDEEDLGPCSDPEAEAARSSSR